jgi:phosphatidylglycerophosphate synthase
MTATIVIGSDWPSGIGPETMLLGLPLLRRQVLAAGRAGFERILVEPVRGADLAPLLSGTRGEVLSDGSGGAVRLSAATLVRASALEALREGRTEEASAGARFEIRGPGDLPRAEEWLLSGLIKEKEGFLSRHFERKISLAVSRRLASTSITPNAMTLFSVGVGLLGAFFFLSEHVATQVTGSLLFLAHSILDGCDGELARLKYQESRFGGVLDFWGDNVVHSAVFSAIALGWWRAAAGPLPLILGAAAVAGTLFSAGFVYFQTMRRQREGPLFVSVTRSARTRLARMADALARRDFIYLVVILSFFGKARWFLIAAAVGAPAFSLVLLGIALAGRQAGLKLESADRSYS